MIMFKNTILLVGSIVTSLFVGLLSLYYIAPHLFKQSTEIKVVQSNETIVPFFDNVFRDEQVQSFIINDPFIKRAQPFFEDFAQAGPHDLLGFRNRSIPQTADIITIGDSMTYGNNAPIDLNWPSILSNQYNLHKPLKLYNMSVGGWGAVEYLEIFKKAIKFKPKMVIIAFYTGNDPIESFTAAYTIKRYESLKPNPELTINDLPKVSYPPRPEDILTVNINDKKIAFTPTLRLASNQSHPAIIAGYQIMARVAKQITQIAKQNDIQVAFTIIPTKELIYEPLLTKNNIELTPDYTKLTALENFHLNTLKSAIEQLKDVTYIDTVAPLQQATLQSIDTYPSTTNGHPQPLGYQVIAESIHKALPDINLPTLTGTIGVKLSDTQFQLYYAKDFKLWQITSPEAAKAHQIDLDNVNIVNMRDIANYQHQGTISQM